MTNSHEENTHRQQSPNLEQLPFDNDREEFAFFRGMVCATLFFAGIIAGVFLLLALLT